jgi:hypothetical protein
MDRQLGAALDRHITGNYGEDQYKYSEICDECEHADEEDCGKDPMTCTCEAKDNYLAEQADRKRKER